MPYIDLQDFLKKLERAGELQRVHVEVDPILEISAVVDRVSKMSAGGKALLFEKVKGSKFPVVLNAFGSARRMCLAMECDVLNDLTQKAEDFVASVPGDLKDASWPHAGVKPRQAAQARCQEVVDHPHNIQSYPFLQTWPGDSGASATLPLVITQDPDTGFYNLGMYRVQLLGPGRLAIHWSAESGGGRHCSKYRERRQNMPVAIALGGDPAIILSAMLPLPDSVNELSLAGLLRDAPVDTVPCLTIPLIAPANAEVIIEGLVDRDEVITGSMFGNHTGFYAPAPDAAVITVTGLTRKKDPVFPATVVGRPPMEDCWLMKAGERLMLPFIRRELPQVVDINLPMEWIFHNSAIVSINKSFANDGRAAIAQLRRNAWLRKSRVVIVVDADIDIQNLSLVAWKVINHVDWGRDILTDAPQTRNLAPSVLPGSGSFMGIDATRKSPRERHGLEWPREIVSDEAVQRLVESRWREYGF